MKAWFDWMLEKAGLLEWLDPVSWHGVTVVCIGRHFCRLSQEAQPVASSRHTGESRYPAH
jgi:hypothetical protein